MNDTVGKIVFGPIHVPMQFEYAAGTKALAERAMLAAAIELAATTAGIFRRSAIPPTAEGLVMLVEDLGRYSPFYAQAHIAALENLVNIAASFIEERGAPKVAQALRVGVTDAREEAKQAAQGLPKPCGGCGYCAGHDVECLKGSAR